MTRRRRDKKASPPEVTVALVTHRGRVFWVATDGGRTRVESL